MIDRSHVQEKMFDLLAMEGRAAELYKEALDQPESAKYVDALTRIMNDELNHIKLVKRALDLI